MMNKQGFNGIGRAKYLLLTAALLMIVCSCATRTTMQAPLSDNEKEVTTDNPQAKAQDEPVYKIVEKSPEFPGGEYELARWIGNNMRYPVECIEKGIQGKVTVSFTVNTDGSISDARVLSGVYMLLDAEAVRLIMAMPKWIPGEQRGEKVRVRMNAPVTFYLVNR